jgi:RNA polymerase sigma factor (sigma-70 family)
VGAGPELLSSAGQESPNVVFENVDIFAAPASFFRLHNRGVLQPHEVHDLRLARQGDRQAMDRLLTVLRPRLEKLARRFAEPGSSRGSTADLAQEAALRLWQRLAQFQGGPDDEQTAAMFQDWVSQLVRHLARDRQRQRHAQRREPPGGLRRLGGAAGGGASSGAGGNDPAASGPTPSANVRAEEQAHLIRKALQKIPDPTNRKIVELCFFDGLSLRQIAGQLNLSYDKVRQGYHRSLKLLERELGDAL